MLTESESALARAVLIHGPISRSALTSRLNLSPASLTRLAKPFLDNGVLVELDDYSDGSVGRPVRPLDVSPSLGGFVGVKLTGDVIYAVATDARANPTMTIEAAIADRDPAAVAQQIVGVVHALGASELVGVGVAIGASVTDDTVERAPFLGWEDVPFAEMLSAVLGVPVTLENDLIALAEAEHWFGSGRGIPGFNVITIGTGIGHALVIHDQVVRSREAGVGLAGHIPLAPSGPRCSLGHIGCAQAMLTSGSIAAQVSAALRRPVTYDDSLALARQGDPAARSIVDAASDALGRLIALAADFTLQPTVVLAGDGIELFGVNEERVKAAALSDRDPLADPLSIHVDRSGFTAWARGAAAIAIQAALRRLNLADRQTSTRG
ncbi:ROK family transcriptional regulator [Microbacterium terrae]|uniref:N-acetylglucosamine repressor n=1 Tax=Microbacterium terrae TaxID=69369 RepID=A0A0M2GX90_9MICO|nr:ROK family protein [Microbacterium terrae]KJL38518.1 N-acetylglucosamine repressor [Microbacterium terrae]GLJ98239.1 MarR family transcriptional regulator [Microbacterium terrae]